MNKPRRIITTAALIYANGPLHLGHLVEYIQTDIWTRFQKLIGNECYYICGSDAHGTPIMIGAEKQGLSPEQLIQKIYHEHQEDFKKFFIEFDNFYSSHSEENKQLVELIYNRLQEHGDISTKTVKQAYDPIKEMFLPDRYVKGTCPRCKTLDQYGDNCEACGCTYAPTDLINPVSILSGATPIEKESLHYFFELKHFEAMLKKWLHAGHLQEQVVNKLDEWFAEGLRPWDISRDAPYFGFEIPNAPGKYFYVWLDAPIGYMASFKNLCDKNKALKFEDFWNADSKTELYHFIGKDIVYFHALFWPAMLDGSNIRKPNAIFAHGYLTINGQKMSKSRGTFITACHYLQYLNPEYLRYYYAAKLNNRIEDIDLNFADFTQRINADLVNKVVNIASRCAGFITKLFDGKLADRISVPDLFSSLVQAGKHIAELYEKREFSSAMREIMLLADRVNQYIDEVKPWVLAKLPDQQQEVHAICTLGLNLFKIIITYLKPVLPKLAAEVEQFLNIPCLTWQNRADPLLNHSINPFKPLMQRVDSKTIDALLSNNAH